MSNFHEMYRNGSRMAVQKNFKLLKYEHIMYSFEACDIEISNMQLLLLNIQISRKYEQNRFHEIS